MTPQDEEDDGVASNRICSGCVGEKFLSASIRKSGESAECSYCEQQGKTISIEELSDHIETAFEQHYRRTATEPSPMEYTMIKEGDYNWEREGQQTVYAIEDAAHIPSEAAEHVQEVLSERHYDFDSAAAGEETPFDADAYYEESSVDDAELQADWSYFQKSLATESRLFNRTAEGILDSIFEGLDKLTTSKRRKVIVSAGPGKKLSALYRTRVFQSDDDKLAEALSRPDLGLGPPPPRFASAGRMNSRGIAVFYGATDANVALAETRPPVGSRVLVGRFEIIRPLRLLDVEALRSIYVKGSIFDGVFIKLACYRFR